MMADSYFSKPQREEYFCDSGYYKYHEAYHLLKFPNEKQILEQENENGEEMSLIEYNIDRDDHLYLMYTPLAG